MLWFGLAKQDDDGLGSFPGQLFVLFTANEECESEKNRMEVVPGQITHAFKVTAGKE